MKPPPQGRPKNNRRNVTIELGVRTTSTFARAAHANLSVRPKSKCHAANDAESERPPECGDRRSGYAAAVRVERSARAARSAVWMRHGAVWLVHCDHGRASGALLRKTRQRGGPTGNHHTGRARHARKTAPHSAGVY